MKTDKITVILDEVIFSGLVLMMFSSAVSIAGSSIGLGFSLLAWFAKLGLTRKTNLGSNPFNTPLIIFVLTSTFSLIGSYNLKESILFLENFILVFLLYYMIVDNISDLKQVNILFKTGIVSIVIASLYAIIWQHYYLGQSRVDAWFMALDFGALLLIYTLYSLSFSLWGFRKISQRFKYGFFSLVIFSTLIFNKTRGAWLGFLGSFSLLLWIRSKKFIPVLILFIVLLVFLAPADIQKRIASIADLENNRSNLGRLALWKGAVLIFKDHPINGIGLGNFQEVYQKYYQQPNTTSTSHAHNNFFNFLAETGIIGLMGFIYLLYYICRYLYLNYLKVDKGLYKIFILATLVMFIGVYVIQGLTEFNFYKSVVGRTVWSLLGLTVALIRISNEEN